MVRSERRCVLCFHLSQDLREKRGQIAHLDKDPSNGAQDNLAFMCLDHHSLFDSRTSQHKNYTLGEVKAARSLLYEAIAEKRRAVRIATEAPTKEGPSRLAGFFRSNVAEADQTRDLEPHQSTREGPISTADLSERGGRELDGYKVCQGLKLTVYSNGIDGSVLILVDERISGLSGGMLKDPYSDVEMLEVCPDPTLWLLETDQLRQSPPPQLRQALLLVVDRELRTLYHEQLGRESARIDRVYLYPDKSKPTFVVTRDYSIGWGSYNGPVSYFLEVSASAGIRYVLPHGLMTSLKTAWAILGSSQAASEILSKKCRPNFEERSADGHLKFQVIYERFHFDGTLWQPMLIQEDGFWEADRKLDPAEIRIKFGTAS